MIKKIKAEREHTHPTPFLSPPSHFFAGGAGTVSPRSRTGRRLRQGENKGGGFRMTGVVFLNQNRPPPPLSGQASPVGGRHRALQPHRRQGGHAGVEAVGGLGEREKRFFFLVISKGGTCVDFHLPSLCHRQTLIYAGQPMANDKKLAEYGVPPVRERERGGGGGGSRQFFPAFFGSRPPTA